MTVAAEVAQADGALADVVSAVEAGSEHIYLVWPRDVFGNTVRVEPEELPPQPASTLAPSGAKCQATAAHAGGDVDPSSMLRLGPMAALLAGLCCGVMLSRAAASRCGRGLRARDEYGVVQPHVDGDGELVALEPSARSL